MPVRPLLLCALLAGSVAALGGCSRDNADRDAAPAGKPVNLSGLRDFTSVDVAGPDSVIIAVGKPFAVDAQGNDRALAALEVAVVNGQLRIGRKRGLDSWWNNDGDGATIQVSMPSIDRASLTGSGDLAIAIAGATGKSLALALTGSGDIELSDAKLADLTADLTGSGNMLMSGTAGKAVLSAMGSGDLDAQRLKAGSATISLTGTGDIAIASDGPVDIQIMGTGDVDVKGKAQCKVAAMGIGEARCKP